MLQITISVPNQENVFLSRLQSFNENALSLHEGDFRDIMGTWVKVRKEHPYNHTFKRNRGTGVLISP
jgi:hypothetical protein